MALTEDGVAAINHELNGTRWPLDARQAVIDLFERIAELEAEVERLRKENAGLRQDVEGWQRLVNCQAIYLDRAAKLPERLHQCRAERHALRARIAELEDVDNRVQAMADRIAGQSADNLMRAQAAERRVVRLEGVLREVEWAARDADDDGKPIETCPACRWWKTQGHHPQCDLDAALRDAHD